MPGLTPAQRAEAKRLWHDTDETAAAIGKRLGVSKSTIIGIAARDGWLERQGGRRPRGGPPPLRVRDDSDRPSTVFDRMAALHAMMDRVLDESREAIKRSPSVFVPA